MATPRSSRARCPGESGPKPGTTARTLGFAGRLWSLGGSLIFVEEAAEDWPALDLFLGKILHGVIGPGWLELECAVRSSPVVVLGILGHHDAQVSFAEDRHPVGDFSPGGEHEPLRIGVSREDFGAGILTASIPASARTASKEALNCPARSRIGNWKSAERSPRFIRRLRICCVVHGPSGLAVMPRTCT